MKIGLSEMYKTYDTALKERKVGLTQDRANYVKSKNYLLERLEESKHYIKTFTNIEYDSIPELNRHISEKHLSKLANLQGVDINHIRRAINVIVEINRCIKKIDEQLIEINECIVDEEIFRDVICTFNTAISDEIIYKAYTFKLGLGLGVVKIKRVLCNTRVKKRINWGESNKKRKELELQGKLPFKVLERDANRKPVRDNGGEHWMVYWSDDHDYVWHWSKNRNIVYNSAYYKFSPTLYNNSSKGGKLGNINKLAELKRTNSPLLANYL